MLSRMEPLVPYGPVITLLPDTGLSKLTRSEKKPFYKNHFKTRIGCYWSLVTMFDQKKEGMQFARNFTVLEVTRLSEDVKRIS